MSWGEVFGFVGTILGIAAALDFAVRKAVKKRFSSVLKTATTKGGSFDYQGSVVLDRLFGNGLFSRRALFRYSLISFSSICISYAFALLTTADPDALKQIALFPKEATALGGLVLAICVAFAVVGDFASYAITRLFIRTVDQYRNSVISAGLIAADVISSLALFFLSFSVARLLSYLLVLSVGQNSLTASDAFSLDVLRAGTSLLGNPSYSVEKKMSPLALTALLASSESDTNAQRAAAYFKNAEIPASLSNEANAIRYVARRSCLKDAGSWASSTSNTIDLVESAAEELNESRTAKIDTAKLKDDLSKASYALNFTDCTSTVVAIDRELPTSTLLSVAGPGNSYLAALERTAFDAYSVTSFKLAPYVHFDPAASLPEYYVSLQTMLQNTFLALSAPDQDKVSLIETYTTKKQEGGELVNVPFSPMVASSLTSSAVFLGYLALSIIVSVRNSLFAAAGKQLARFDLDNAVFTTIALSIASIALSLKALQALLAVLWQLLV